MTLKWKISTRVEILITGARKPATFFIGESKKSGVLAWIYLKMHFQIIIFALVFKNFRFLPGVEISIILDLTGPMIQGCYSYLNLTIIDSHENDLFIFQAFREQCFGWLCPLQSQSLLVSILNTQEKILNQSTKSFTQSFIWYFALRLYRVICCCLLSSSMVSQHFR